MKTKDGFLIDFILTVKMAKAVQFYLHNEVKDGTEINYKMIEPIIKYCFAGSIGCYYHPTLETFVYVTHISQVPEWVGNGLDPDMKNTKYPSLNYAYFGPENWQLATAIANPQEDYKLNPYALYQVDYQKHTPTNGGIEENLSFPIP